MMKRAVIWMYPDQNWMINKKTMGMKMRRTTTTVWGEIATTIWTKTKEANTLAKTILTCAMHCVQFNILAGQVLSVTIPTNFGGVH